MSNYLIKSETLTNIANAIRTKTGKTDSIPTENMASEISGLPIYPLYDGAVEEINFAFTLKYPANSYSVSGIGDVTATNIRIPATYNNLPVAEIGQKAFQQNTNIQSVVLANSIQLVSSSAFSNCSALTTVIIPDSVTRIDNFAFEYCKVLTDVKIGKGISYIGNATFQMCFKLKNVTIQATTPPTLGGSAVFQYNDANLTIYVPAESVEAYKSATNWSAYADKIQAIQN